MWMDLRTEVLPVMPMYMLKGRAAVSNMIAMCLSACRAMLFAISKIMGSPADGGTVSLHDTPLLPSRPPGLDLESRRSTRHSDAHNTSWWPRRRLYHVSLGNAQSSCSTRLFHHRNLGACPPPVLRDHAPLLLKQLFSQLRLRSCSPADRTVAESRPHFQPGA